MNIRDAKLEDAEEILAIYAPYINDTAITFEYVVPELDEFKERIINIQKKYPYLVAEDETGLLGYAYAGTFKDRAAYDHSVETTIYLKTNQRGKGIGKALYTELEKRLEAIGILNLNACIAWKEEEDERLTHQSPNFHASMGYTKCAHFHLCGYKFNTWYDMIWMEKLIGQRQD